MKIRLGFVSNSSSSSFTCDTCDETFSGWDASVEDFEHCECERGHIFCRELKVEQPKPVNIDPDSDEECDDESYESYLDPKYCPICQFKVITPNMRERYLKKMYNKNEKEIDAEIMSKFGSYEEFSEFLK